MMQHDQSIARRPEGFEHSDLSAANLGKFLAGLVIALIVVGGIVTGFYLYLEAVWGRQDAPLSSLAGPRQPPLGPALQVRPQHDLASFRADEDALLQSYGWVDRKNDVVRIPIDRAMGLVVQRGVKAPWGKAGR
jgi:hypothetical protein